MKSLQTRILVLSLAALAGFAAVAGTAVQGGRMGNVLPIVSTTDCIGFVAPCG